MGNQTRQGGPVTDDLVAVWFVQEVLPIEAVLMGYLRHNWPNLSDIADLRQEVYARVFASAREHLPENAKRFVLVTARNLLIDLVRREQVVPIDAVADLDALGVPVDTAGPERATMAREDLRRLQVALTLLSPRAREAITLAYVEGLSGKEVARRMGVTKATASEHLANGIRSLTDLLADDLDARSVKR